MHRAMGREEHVVTQHFVITKIIASDRVEKHKGYYDKILHGKSGRNIKTLVETTRAWRLMIYGLRWPMYVRAEAVLFELGTQKTVEKLFPDELVHVTQHHTGYVYGGNR